MSTDIAETLDSAANHRLSVCTEIRSSARMSVPYLLMNVFATVVASYGLFENSTAVVIGAMVIAGLLGPITGIALALISGDNPLLRAAIMAELYGVFAVLAVAFCIGVIHRDLPLTAQILSRTTPNIMDLFIALGGGAAAAYATISPRLSVGLVGVAIATALVPPLSACSICLARGEFTLAFGAFLLFVANMVGIQFASSIVMVLHGYHKTSAGHETHGQFARRNAVSVLLLAGLTVALAYDFSQFARKEAFESKTRHQLEVALSSYPGVYLADLRFANLPGSTVVTAVLRTPFSFSPERVALLEAKLPKAGSQKAELHIRSVITKETTKFGYLQELPAQKDADDTDKIGQ